MKRVLKTDALPPALGPYSPGVMAGPFLFLAQGPIVSPSGAILEGSMKEQVQLTLNNVDLVLAEGGMDRDDVVSVTIYLDDMTQYQGVNELYGAFFKRDYPCRVTVEVSALPPGVHVEMSAIAYGKGAAEQQ